MAVTPADTRNPRQMAAYRHTCDIWSVGRTVDATTGKAGAETYTLVYTGVHCLYDYTKNYDDAIPGAGRIKRQTSETQDTIHYTADQPVKDAWLTVNTTILSDGSNSPSRLEVHRILGAPLNVANAGSRRANKRSVLAMSVEHPPATIKTYYGL